MLRKNTLTKYAKKKQQINVYLQDMLRKTGLLGRRNSVMLFQT